jgi:hypothetical protein
LRDHGHKPALSGVRRDSICIAMLY